MAEWMTAEQVAVRYVVGERRLLEYAERGNLAMRRCADGRVLFDAEGVARFFRVRGAAAPAAGPGARAQHLGVLGVARLGEAVVAQAATGETGRLGAREERRRALRFAGSVAPVRTAMAKAG